MKKDHLRDYCTNAFRTYAEAGKPDVNCVKMFYEPHIKYGSGKAADICAVSDTLCRLRGMPDGALTVHCVDIVYFTEPRRAVRKNDISARVVYASRTLNVDISTVYRRLKLARDIFSEVRGLNVASSRP